VLLQHKTKINAYEYRSGKKEKKTRRPAKISELQERITIIERDIDKLTEENELLQKIITKLQSEEDSCYSTWTTTYQ
jgi:SMC interacting uncharacterized protein involved in chromosome segregation